MAAPPAGADAGGYGSLVDAAAAGALRAVRSLLLSGADPAASGPDGAPLSLAVENGRAEVARCLLDWQAETGADVGVHARDALGRTALHKAARGADVSLVVRLLKAGADPNALCGKRWSALNAVACSTEGPEEFRLRATEALIERGADLDNRIESGGFTPLHQACFRDNHSVAALLVRRGADARAVSAAGFGVLAAAQTYPIELVRLLLRAGADPEHPNRRWTPLHMAAAAGRADVAAELLLYGADVDGGAPRRTPLSAAARNGQGEAVRLLIDAGACTDAGANPPDTDWSFVAASALRWRREAEAALASERAAHEATQESFRFALPHLLAAASRSPPRPASAAESFEDSRRCSLLHH
jgi:ankyrin repeat protein